MADPLSWFIWNRGIREQEEEEEFWEKKQEEDENEVGSVELGCVVSWKGNRWFWFLVSFWFGLVFGFFLGCWCAWGCWFVEWISLFPNKGLFYLFIFIYCFSFYLIPCQDRRMEKKGREKRKKENKNWEKKEKEKKGLFPSQVFYFNNCILLLRLL